MARFANVRALCAGLSLGIAAATAMAQDAQPAGAPAQSAPSGATSANPVAAMPVASSPTANPIVVAPGQTHPAAPQVPTPMPWHGRMISSDVAAQLAAAAPKYTPPPSTPPPRQAEETDTADSDQPKNHIIHLPRYVVHAPPPPVLNERTVNTQKGLEDIAMKRYLTDVDRALNKFTLPLFGTSAGARALEMYREDERLKNMADLSEDAKMVGATDKAAGLYVKKQVEQTFMRPGDFDWKPIGR